MNIGDESIAYRDLGGSGLPIVYLGTNGSHQDLIWDEPGCAHFLRSLAALGRLVTYDRRGSGLSSRTVKPTIEVRVADIDACARRDGHRPGRARRVGADRPRRRSPSVRCDPIARVHWCSTPRSPA